MPCRPFSHEGMTGFICGGPRAARCGCGNRGVFLCDWKVEGKKTGTCDADLCGRCAKSPEPEKHLCPTHFIAWGEWRRRKKAVESGR